MQWEEGLRGGPEMGNSYSVDMRSLSVPGQGSQVVTDTLGIGEKCSM